ncbi:Asp-tRNA(Asn)/Glu-tRNA(Gln) amidotransferase subunit GatC [Candidatus Microgenomates bacterium]|nr:Asp-tRNA(Asn)/Glu-tRNA(Gln) amidotransferase subunit GatC [Candidatus Microgenomates bacterium]
MKTKLSQGDIQHVAKLAKLPVSKEQLKKFYEQLLSVVGYMSKIQKLDTNNVVETSQITGLENVFREDEIDEKRLLTQDQTLANTKRKYKGYFVVDAVFDNE